MILISLMLISFISCLFYYCISDIVIYLIYIDLMRKRCQLVNVNVDADRSPTQEV